MYLIVFASLADVMSGDFVRLHEHTTIHLYSERPSLCLYSGVKCTLVCFVGFLKKKTDLLVAICYRNLGYSHFALGKLNFFPVRHFHSYCIDSFLDL